ncbi:hypothetical protein GA0061078_1013 [Bifidobacterium bohemicum]|uniref:Uncharacterized protein n=1 Tax=Bifidobacterium bohemicum DSM 22767 TaxID=1437606 RepID=A0A086ZEB7_9BIFI|nr:hypothetical protein BBOH_1598 [Bifidobacterium bohemicum DSM 22767]SCB95933.1 hypothetical protein GA0061078_1013 [Bifidobacterium bohemicum]
MMSIWHAEVQCTKPPGASCIFIGAGRLVQTEPRLRARGPRKTVRRLAAVLAGCCVSRCVRRETSVDVRLPSRRRWHICCMRRIRRPASAFLWSNRALKRGRRALVPEKDVQFFIDRGQTWFEILFRVTFGDVLAAMDVVDYGRRRRCRRVLSVVRHSLVHR